MREWIVGVGLALAVAGSTVAQTPAREALAVPGLAAPAEIVVDRWGIPHIYAASSRDAFFLQGWNAGRDRLWQIDLWRKRGLGRLSASFGPAYVDQDRAARLFLYRGDMAAEWAAYAPGSREAVEAFTAGVNAYVAQVAAGTRPLPVEFRLTASRPEAWAPEDVLRIRSHALVSNVGQEVARSQVACAAGIQADRLRRKIEPAHETKIPEGLDPCAVPADVLKDYLLATQAVSFEPLTGRRMANGPAPQTQLTRHMEAAGQEGSNNWVISGSRTASGRPILANDPHRAVGAPSLRYIVHLNAPDLTIIGAGEPALPGVSLGHNGKAAFGITIFAVDQEDLYVYQTRGRTYRYQDRWEPMQTLVETLEVKGEAPRRIELAFTRHGPVLKEDQAAGQAFALRTIWNEPGLSGYFGSSRLWRASSWADFNQARNRWGAPPLNLVYADTSGTVGWAASARVPVRRTWDGLMPVPGDGRYEWAGFHADDTLPSLRNPAKGWFGTANEMNLPAGYPNAVNRIAFEWADRSRITRVEEVLAQPGKATLEGSMALQTSAVSPQARRAVALLNGVRTDDLDVAWALRQLVPWDGHEATDSVPAALYNVWTARHLGRAVVAQRTPAAAQGLVGSGQLQPVLEEMEARPDAALLTTTLKAAMADLADMLGPDRTGWTWGRLHQAQFDPAIAVLADRDLAARMRLGPVPVPGSGATPRAASYRPTDFRQMAGASVRMVLDVGAWDNSMAINTPGQSADPDSRHYGDLFPLWAAGQYVPLRFSRTAVMGDAETVISLSPGR